MNNCFDQISNKFADFQALNTHIFSNVTFLIWKIKKNMFFIKKRAFEKLKRSENLLEILLKLFLFQNFDVLAVKLSIAFWNLS